MECEKIKEIIPKYFKHTVSEEEIQLVEEHLCICHDCRTILGELMDKAEETSPQTPEKAEEPLSEQKPEEKLEQNKETPEASSDQKKDMEYFSGGDIESSLDKIDEILEAAEPVKQEVEEKEPPFEILTEPPFPEQELPVESDAEKQEEEPPKEIEPFLRKAAEGKEDSKLFLREEPEEISEEVSEEFTATTNQPNKQPIIKKQGDKADFLGYLCLIVGLGVLGFLAYLLTKG